MDLINIGYEVLKENEIKKYQIRLSNNLRLEQIFILSEQIEDDRSIPIKLIQDDQWENHNPKEFKIALEKSKHPGMLTNYSVGEFDKMKLFKLKGYDIGFALKNFNGKDQEIVAVFNNSGIGGLGKFIMQSAIKHGGCYLDHFDGFLTDLYTSNGFVEYNREPFNNEYDPDSNFRSKYGERDIIYRKHKNCQ